MSRARYLAVRTLQTVFLLWLALTFLFFFFRMLPGSFTDLMVFQGASPEAIEAFEDKWGLNDPLYVQYFRYLVNFVQLDVGTSIQYRKPVWEFVRMKIFNSFILVGPAITVSYLLGSTIGTVFGNARGSTLERRGLLPIIFFGAFPSFFIAIVAIIVFAGWLNWFPTSGMLSYQSSIQFENASWWRPYTSKDFLMHYILPFSTILFRYLYLPVMIMRTSVVEVKEQGFFFYHRVTGLPYVNRLQHLAKHASLPVITMYPVSMTRALGGLVLIEVVFNWPGIGFTLVQAVLARDYPTVQFVFFLVAAFIVIANFTIDILYGYIDPRVNISGETSA